MMARTLRGIRENLESMKRTDNAWANRYVRDVGWLLNRLNELVVAFDSTRMGERGVNQGCWCAQSPTDTNQPDWKHTAGCKKNMALLQRVRESKEGK